MIIDGCLTIWQDTFERTVQSCSQRRVLCSCGTNRPCTLVVFGTVRNTKSHVESQQKKHWCSAEFTLYKQIMCTHCSCCRVVKGKSQNRSFPVGHRLLLEIAAVPKEFLRVAADHRRKCLLEIATNLHTLCFYSILL